jgi:hypothetical protein
MFIGKQGDSQKDGNKKHNLNEGGTKCQRLIPNWLKKPV